MKAQIYPAVYQQVGRLPAVRWFIRGVFLAQICCLQQRIPSTTLVCPGFSNHAHLRDSRCRACLVPWNFRDHYYPLNCTLAQVRESNTFLNEQVWLLSPHLRCWTQPALKALGQYVTTSRAAGSFDGCVLDCPHFAPVWSHFGSANLSSSTLCGNNILQGLLMCSHWCLDLCWGKNNLY